MGLAGDRVLHGYHCDCESCDYDNYTFRGQTDSSCSGEIISSPLGPGPAPNPLMLLEQAAVEVDAEPGMTAGFHVHVYADDLFDDARADVLWQFIRWEPVLGRLAGGRWPVQRGGMNRTVREELTAYWYDYIAGGSRFTTTNILAIEQRDSFRDEDSKHMLMRRHYESDRHSNLNINTNHGTWEFRLWNSTRSAWRMELFCAASVAFMDPATAHALAELTPPTQAERYNDALNDIALAFSTAGHDRAAELTQRQYDYITNRAADAPASLTVV